MVRIPAWMLVSLRRRPSWDAWYCRKPVSLNNEVEWDEGTHKVGPVVDAGSLGRRATKHLWLPSVEMRIKMNHGNGTVNLVDTSQDWEDNGMITAQCNNSRMRLALQARTRLIRVSSRLPGEKCMMSVLDLLDGIVVVISPWHQLLCHSLF